MPRTPATVLILGSSPDAMRIRSWPRPPGVRLVAINNAWALRPDWDDLIHPEDFPPTRLPTDLRPGQRRITAGAFVPAQNAFGGFVYAGGTMAFTAGYWALEALRPQVLAFLGCDMVYPAEGRTHFYGRGKPDPLRDDPTLQSLEAKASRLAALALGRGTLCVNLSVLGESRLTFPKLDLAALAGPDPSLIARLRDEAEASLRPALVARALAGEQALGYLVEDGRYWRELARFDPAELAALDRLWLGAMDRGRAAA